MILYKIKNCSSASCFFAVCKHFMYCIKYQCACIKLKRCAVHLSASCKKAPMFDDWMLDVNVNPIDLLTCVVRLTLVTITYHSPVSPSSHFNNTGL